MQAASLTDQACPFCGLACDDLTLVADDNGVRAAGPACARATRLFATVGAPLQGQAQAWIDGQPALLEAAILRAQQHLGAARAPLFGGLSTDVTGMRALMDLADQRGAVLDHMNAEGKLRNLRTVQDAGWITTTLSEVRNRSDLVVCFGTDVATRYPRFFERCVCVDDTLFAASPLQREVVFVGAPAEAVAAVMQTDGTRAAVTMTTIDIAVDRLPEAAALLRGLVAGTLPPELVTDLPLAALRTLAERLRAAQYGVIVWVAADMDWPHAELTIQALTGLIGTINQTTRCAGLPLGGSDGDFSADAVMLWQTGYPYRTSLASGTGQYDPVMNATAALLTRNEVDLLLWVSTFDPARSVPDTGAVPLVALTGVGTPVLPGAAVQIQVATPGVDASGYYFRADKVVALPLRAVTDRQLPTVAQLARRFASGLGAV